MADVDTELLKQILAKGTLEAEGTRGMYNLMLSLLSAVGGGGKAVSPTASFGAQDSAKAKDMMSRLRSTEGGKGAELAPVKGPELPRAGPPEKPPDARSEIRRNVEVVSEKIAVGLNKVRSGLEAFDDPERTIESGRKKGGFLGGAQATAGFGVKALQNQSELGGIGDVLGGAGEAGGTVPVVGKPIKAFFQLGETVVKSVDKLKQWNEQLHEGNMRFAEWSGAMAGVKAAQQLRDLELSQERGQRRAATANFLAEEKHGLNKRLAIFEDTMGNLKNLIGGGASSIGSKMYDVANSLTGFEDRLKQLNKEIDKLVGGMGTQVEGWVERVATEDPGSIGYAYQKYGRPRRF